jgi:hypothetical protein
MQGRVVAITPANAGAVTIRVETNPGTQTGPKVLAYTDDITLVRLPGNQEATYRAVQVGQWIRLWMEGAVTDSYPQQGTARAIAVDSLGSQPQ